MNRNLRFSFASLLAAAFLAAHVSPAGAIFGIGVKKKTEPPKAQSRDDALPGLVQGPDQALPKMAAEAEKERSQDAPPAEQKPESQASAETKVSESETAVGANPSPVMGGAMPQEVVIKTEAGGKLKAKKSPLQIQVDPFESIRDSIRPDQQLLLAESPLTVVWRRTHPEFLRNARVIAPWRSAFSERPGMVFRPRDMLGEVLGRRIDPKEAKGYQWSLTIVDEEGKVFQQFDGSSNPPEELIWEGQNEQDEWIKAGKAYSSVYMFTDPAGTPYTRPGRPIKHSAFLHQERTGLHISIDSTALFGPNKESAQLVGDGQGMLRAAADLIKRRYPGVPLRVEAFASTKELGERQAQTAQEYLVKELMLMPQDISAEADKAGFSDQRLEIIMLNR
ncbi:MAG: hypothetical protein HY922_10325 [Elusimicrobia bacterium]|nr:hypothetical protein [Elusimicrobiota bacterium]